MSIPQFPISDEQLQALPPEFRGMMELVKAFCQELIDENQSLKARIAKLEEQLAQNSRNSSKPPSSDGPAHTAASSAKPSGKKRGGQRGHKKAQRELIPAEQCRSVVELIPEQCGHCGQALAGVDPQPRRHQVWDIPPIQPIVDEYRQHCLCCQTCGKSTRVDLPTGVPTGQAGPNLIAHVGLLLTKYRMSQRLVAEYLKTICGIPCSEGWIAKLQRVTSRSLARPYESISQQLRQAAVVHIDETSYKLENRKGWLWGAFEKGASLFRIASSRGAKIARDMLGTAFSGIVISDRYSSYHWLGSRRRQLCWAHLKRDFTKLSESKHEPTRQVGAGLLQLQQDIFADWHRFKAGQLARSALRRKVPRWQGEMHGLLERGWLQGNKAAAGTCRNLWRDFDALWTFARVAGVEPTNNTAERGLRGGVIKRKLSFGVASASGRQFLERTLSVLATCRQQGIAELAYLQSAIQADFAGHPAPILLKSP